MALTALILVAVFVGLTVGVRIAIQIQRTGSSGFHPPRGELRSPERLVGIFFVFGVALVLLAPIFALLGLVEPIEALDGHATNVLGVILAGLGIVLVFGTQLAMGDAWRVGVDPEDRTELVTDGIFMVVRNPIYSFTILTVVGFVLMLPNVLFLLGFVLLWIWVELLVRFIEEPHLLSLHGGAFQDYASRVGRFVPGVGAMLPPAETSSSSELRGAP
jgi:protein-S-isoprenylcysteine O-methyltransferase Ste14